MIYSPLFTTFYHQSISVFPQSIAQESLEEAGEADPKRDCLGVVPSGFLSWKLLQDPTLVGAPWFPPRTFWQERREAPPLHLAKHLALSTYENWGQLQQGYVLIARYFFSTFSWTALYWAGIYPRHKDSFLLTLHSATL